MIIPILIALSLNFDTFSVTVVEGAQAVRPSIKNALKVSVIFGLAQALFALSGALLGLGFKSLIANTDHWVAFILLLVIGTKLIKESFQKEKCESKLRRLNFRALFFLAVATSIDALIVGITFAFLKDSVTSYILVIGLVTLVVSFIGYRSGRALKKICGSKARMIGGLILIAIGVKTLIQHLYFGG
jgi:putative Mn2+ efflux pump MntP